MHFSLHVNNYKFYRPLVSTSVHNIVLTDLKEQDQTDRLAKIKRFAPNSTTYTVYIVVWGCTAARAQR